jgi:hypothetical protein
LARQSGVKSLIKRIQTYLEVEKTARIIK